MNDSVRIKEPKSGRSRTVALPASVRDELRAHKLKQAQALLKIGVRVTNDSFVAPLEDGSMLRPVLLTHEWRHAIRGTALPCICFHDLRHAHATHMLKSGVHPKVASERLGHSQVLTKHSGRPRNRPENNPTWFATILLPNCLKTDKTR